ncbi:MAG: hypothetical protein RIE06_00760 [Roseibium album]|uniref:Uncharacterized protein n=1 Tax=Roseibium album TaxID=311410 RepID=A0A0M6Z5T6_9HYPH|nr:hypothetical protein [Roseibium album]MBG6160059.1 hypothetical protein [Labrenzia sp. EL_162]MBG6166094.1 hypothetical protein [Labrenzia sp. EL_195]MBG6178196.1 hypothetical protein [Labrenzia sp. EL_132]MBG6198591.1 hypothetical protein [Labrenzia sp. EL_159]MBG6204976.1 hypothetical protein [Labrenzia sp. EL_13]MBG6210247.1 hypothetical protein [Labrenzia sp. EL_126]MBG6232819.1 hypothetical protein [Labrenzia sp. EL_208]
MDLTLDHRVLEEAHETRRYFAKFERIITHLQGVADSVVSENTALFSEIPILKQYLEALSGTFTALSYKYLLAGRVSDKMPNLLSIDRQDSGFPIYQELLEMANDAMQAENHLRSLPVMRDLKVAMVNHILREQTAPVNLQFAASERQYYEQLNTATLFWARNDPRLAWTGNVTEARRKYRIHWAVYDSLQNIPLIYVMDLEDSGKRPLAKDERRWPRVQGHLTAQSSAGLKLLTIARGFDHDFADLHPKRLRRFYVGPMYSHTFTQQSGPLREVLAQAGQKPGEDWALAWTTETLVASGTEQESTGFFSSVERQIYDLDPFAAAGDDTNEAAGHTHRQRSLILPQRPYQVLEELNPPGLANIRKYAVSPSGKILSYK